MTIYHRTKAQEAWATASTEFEEVARMLREGDRDGYLAHSASSRLTRAKAAAARIFRLSKA